MKRKKPERKKTQNFGAMVLWLSTHTRNARDCEFESYTCHIKNTIGEEGNRKPPHANPLP